MPHRSSLHIYSLNIESFPSRFPFLLNTHVSMCVCMFVCVCVWVCVCEWQRIRILLSLLLAVFLLFACWTSRTTSSNNSRSSWRKYTDWLWNRCYARGMQIKHHQQQGQQQAFKKWKTRTHYYSYSMFLIFFIVLYSIIHIIWNENQT